MVQARAQEARANWESALSSKDRALQQLEATLAVQRHSTVHADPSQGTMRSAPQPPAPAAQQLGADVADEQPLSGGNAALQAAQARGPSSERVEHEVSALRAALGDARAEAARERAAAAAALADCQATAASTAEAEREVTSLRAALEEARVAAARHNAAAAASADQHALDQPDARHEQELRALRAALEEARSEAAEQRAAACAERARQAEAASHADERRRIEAAHQASCFRFGSIFNTKCQQGAELVKWLSPGPTGSSMCVCQQLKLLPMDGTPPLCLSS